MVSQGPEKTRAIAREDCDIVAAFIGSPNVGKTTLFNALTGRTELVANWPGATVSLSVGVVRHKGKRVCLVDLPGVYSITGDRADERVAKEFILGEKPDVVVVLVDPTAFERSLTLALEVRETYDRVVVAITKADVLESKSVRLDVGKLARSIGSPVVAVSALKGEGIDELLDAIVEEASRRGEPLRIDYGSLEQHVSRIEEALRSSGLSSWEARWYAVKLMESDEWAKERVRRILGEEGEEIIKMAEELASKYSRLHARNPFTEIIAQRYGLASKIASEAMEASEASIVEARVSRIDLVFAHPVAGPLLSLLILLGVFFIAFAVNTGFPLTTILDYMGMKTLASLIEQYTLSSLLDTVFSYLSNLARQAIPDPIAASLVADGIIGGVGTVLTFLPLIIVVFALMAALEDSGLLTRIAVSFENLFSLFGLPGKTIFPIVVSMGCNVPGVMATRIIESDAQRKAAIFAMPLIPCQARLYVLLAFTSVFLASPVLQALTVTSIYLLSIAVFLLTALLVYKALGGGEEEIILEQVPMKKPSLKVVGWLTWDKTKHFLIRAGTIIFAISIIVWFLVSYGPSGLVENEAESYAAVLGKAIAPMASTILGLPYDMAWRVGMAFINGFVAKEVFVESLAMVAPGAGGVGEEVSVSVLASYNFSVSQVVAILVAATLYIPCLATVSVMYRELGSAKMTLAAIAYTLTVATLLAWLARLLLAAFTG